MSPRRARERAGSAAVRIRSMVRRAFAAVASGGLWQVGGYDGESQNENVEVFPGVGYAARPSDASVAAGNPEVIVVNVGGSHAHPVIIATRDESVRVALDEDETAVFNSQALVKIKNDGTIEATSIGGTAVELALKSELDSLKTYLDAHVHINVTAGAVSSGIPLTASPTPAGTTVLKGE